jgi:hypothetical protein
VCRGFSEAWKRQEIIEQQQQELAEFQGRVEKLSAKIRGVKHD